MKSRSPPSTFADNTLMTINTESARSYHRIVRRRAPSTIPSSEQSFIIMNTIDNDPLTRSILINSAAQKRGFLPNNYRLFNTFEAIRRQRTDLKVPSRLPIISSPIPPTRTSPRADVFGNLTSKMSKLAEQRLVLHDKFGRKQPNSTPITNKREKPFYSLSDADFATDIPNALDIMSKANKTKSVTERYLLEIMRRERLQQARYRLLPINRAPNS